MENLNENFSVYGGVIVGILKLEEEKLKCLKSVGTEYW